MSYSDATPDSPVPNPPLIQAIGASKDAILAALGLTSLIEAYNDGDLVVSDVPGATQRIGRPSLWCLSTGGSYAPAPGGITLLNMDTIVLDNDSHLVPNGPTYNFVAHQTGYYLLYLHITFGNGTVNPIQAAAVITENGGAIELAQDPQIIPVHPQPGAGVIGAECSTVVHLTAGADIQAGVFCTPAGPTVNGGIFNTWAFATMLA